MPTTFEVFAKTREFDRWAYGNNDVQSEEALMLERYLDPELRVLEGGTGAGRLVRFLKARGFRSLAGFDFVPALVDVARQRDESGEIAFHVQDATKLDFADGQFDQAVYLQNILCGLECDMER